MSYWWEKNNEERTDRKMIRKSAKKRTRRRARQITAIVLSSAVIFTTVYSLILNAIALDNPASVAGLVLDTGESVETSELSAESSEANTEAPEESETPAPETTLSDEEILSAAGETRAEEVTLDAPVMMGGDIAAPEDETASTEETDAAPAEEIASTENTADAESPSPDNVSEEADPTEETETVTEEVETTEAVEAADTTAEAEDTTAAETETEAVSSEAAESVEETDAPSETAEPVYMTGTLTYEGEDYKVTVEITEDAKVPEGAELAVSEILKDKEETAAQYEQFLADTRKALNLAEDEAVPSYAARFFDISIMADGSEIEPQSGVKVAIALLDNKIKQDEDLQVVHEVEEGKIETPEKVDTNVVAAEEVVAEPEDTGATGVEASFVAESFSVYGVVYTVDFEYVDGSKWSWYGEGSYSISSILAEIGVQEEIVDVKLKRIIDKGGAENSLFLQINDGIWYLTSEVAFQDTFELSIQTATKIYIFSVKDVSYAMKDAVSSVTADGLSGSTWVVKEGEEYNLHISFEETPSVVQFPTTSNNLEYQLPNNFKPGVISNEPVTLTYTEASVTHTINGCTFSVDADGKVTINLTDFAKEKLAESGDGKFNISVRGSFTQTNDKTDFGGGNIKNITVDDTKDVIVNKSGQYNSSDNKVHYTVTVKADGSLTNVKVSDVISGSALSMDQGSLTYSGNSSNPTGGATANGIDMTFPSMKNGETITINYTASVNWNVIGDGKGTVEQTGNTVKVKPDDVPEKVKDNNLENRISYNPLQKSSGAVQNTEDPDVKRVPWTITVNAQGLKNMKNTTITDHNYSPDVMHYSGDGIKIQKYQVNTDGTASPVGSPVSVSWDTLGIDTETATTWSYKISEDGNYKYEITYTTDVDVTGKNGTTQVSNGVDDGKGNTGGSGAGVGPGSSKIEVDKTVGTVTKDQMTWTVTMDVPATGLNRAILVDTLPHNGSYQDTLNVESLHVEGLEQGDSYALSQSKGKFTLTFYKDADHTAAGLNGTGKARKITVTFTTDNDPLWVAENRTADHTNNVSFQGDNTTVYDSDTGRIPDRGIEKNTTGYKTATINGENKVVFEYTVDLIGLTDADFVNNELQFTDEYSSEYLQFLDVNTVTSSEGIDTYWAQYMKHSWGGERGAQIATPSASGNKLTFTIKKSDLPMNNGEYFARYQLKYYLVAKDSTALLNASLAKEDHIISIGNKVKWGDSEDEVTIDYSYPGVTKENIAPSGASDPNATYDREKGTTGFKIVINPDKLELNNGEPMTLTDTYTGNLSVDYSSIKIVVEPAEGLTGDQIVTYDYKGNNGIFIIPDKCKVTITYDARVIGQPNEWVSYGNTAEMNGYTDSASGRAQMSGSGDGGFNLYSVELFKYDAGHMETGLNGAVFTMVDENGNPMVYPDSATESEKRGKPITFETHRKDGKDGYVTISLNEQEDGISLQKGITYYLKETVSPASHAINNTIYRFTISDNPNYSNYEYHSGDIVKVYDWPIMGRIEINKEIEGPTNLTEEDKKKIKFEITGTYDGETPIKVDQWGYPIEKTDLVKYTSDELAAMDDFKVEVTYAEFTNGKYTMADLVDGQYTVKETAAALPGYNDVATVSTTYQVDTDGNRIGTSESGGQAQVDVTITDHSKYVMNYKNTYSNKTAGYDLVIKKVDANNTSKTLYGAVFKLEKKRGEEYVTVTNSSVDENGNFSIGYANKDSGVTLSGLEPGDYRITEVQAPANYKPMTDSTDNVTGVIEFTIDNNGTVTTTKGSRTVEYVADTNTTDKVVGTYSVKNETKHSYTVTKVDGANVSLKLPGAVFGVWESSYPDTANITDAMNADQEKTSGYLWTYTTDENGRFEIQKEDYEYLEDKIYFFKEITAPEGYEVPQNAPVSYFYFSYPSTPPTAMKPANLGDASRSQTITNDLPNLEVKKLWKNLKGDNLNKDKIDVDSVDFTVWQTIVSSPDATLPESADAWTQFPNSDTVYTIEYKSGNWQSVNIPDAPAIGKDAQGNTIYYRYKIVEDVPEGWVANVDFNNSGREATITNTPEPMEISLKKVWDTPASMDPKKDNPIAYFEIYQQDDSGEWKLIPINGKNENELNSGNNWEMTFAVEAGHQYKIVETRSAPNHWPITSFDTTIVHNGESVSGREMEFSDAGEIEITNTYNEPYLEIRKVWETEADTSVLYPHVRIYRRIVGTSQWFVWKNDETLEPNNNWSKTYKGNDLPNDGNHYEYYVEEISVANNGQTLNPNTFSVSYSASQEEPLQDYGSIAVTNTKYDGKVSVEKKWNYADGTTEAKEGDTARVILQRALADKVGVPVSLTYKERDYQYAWDPSVNANVIVGYNDRLISSSTIVVPVNSDVPFMIGTQGNGENVSYTINNVEQPHDLTYGSTVTLNGIKSATDIVIVFAKEWMNGEVKFTQRYTVDIVKSGEYEDVPGTAVVLNSDNEFKHTWDNLPLNAGNNQEYVYSVREMQVNGKSLAAAGFRVVVEGGDTQDGDITVTNTEIPKGSLKITKEVTVGGQSANGSSKADGTYTFRVTDSAGTKHIVSVVISGGVANTAILNDLPAGNATVQEIPSTNSAVTMDLSSHTVTIVGNTTEASINVAAVTITNDYDATGSVPFKAKKIFENQTLSGGDFEFTLTEYTDSTFGTEKATGVKQTKTNDADGDVVFDDVNYTLSDAGIDAEHPVNHYYIIKEKAGSDSDSTIVYDDTEYEVTVAVYDKGDGTLSVTKTVDPSTASSGYDAEFTNRKEKTGSIIVNKEVLVKNWTSDTESTTTADAEQGTYWFALYDKQVTADDATLIRKFSINVPSDSTKPGKGSFTVEKLPLGTYYLYELTGENGSPITGSSGTIGDQYFTVDGSGNTAELTATNNSKSVTIKNTKETVDKEGIKTWTDNNPDHLSIWLQLFRQIGDGTPVAVGNPVELSYTATEFTWQGLPKYDSNGSEYTYSVREKNSKGEYAAPEGYKNLENGMHVINTPPEDYVPTTEFTGEKTWIDINNKYNLRPDMSAATSEFKVELYSHNQPKDYGTLKWTKDGDVWKASGITAVWDVSTEPWKYDFKNLPIFNDNGEVIQYYSQETVPTGYTKTNDAPISPNYTHTKFSGVEKVTTCSTTSFDLGSGVNLGFVAIKAQGNHLIIWTPRKTTAAEQSAISKYLLEDQSALLTEFDGKTGRIEYQYGIPYTYPAKNGGYAKITISGNEVSLNFYNKKGEIQSSTNIWQYFVKGVYEATYTKGNEDFTNSLTDLPFSFSKKWMNSQNEPEAWKGNITVTIARRFTENSEVKTETVGTYDLSYDANIDQHVTITKSSDTSEGPNLTLAVENNVYTFTTATYLPMSKTLSDNSTTPYEYFVSEILLPDNYHATYKKADGTIQGSGVNWTDNGGTIENEEIKIVLPETGSIGTHPIRMIGLSLVTLAGLLAGASLLRRRWLPVPRKRRSNGRGGDDLS